MSPHDNQVSGGRGTQDQGGPGAIGSILDVATRLMLGLLIAHRSCVMDRPRRRARPRRTERRGLRGARPRSPARPQSANALPAATAAATAPSPGALHCNGYQEAGDLHQKRMQLCSSSPPLRFRWRTILPSTQHQSTWLIDDCANERTGIPPCSEKKKRVKQEPLPPVDIPEVAEGQEVHLCSSPSCPCCRIHATHAFFSGLSLRPAFVLPESERLPAWPHSTLSCR